MRLKSVTSQTFTLGQVILLPMCCFLMGHVAPSEDNSQEQELQRLIKDLGYGNLSKIRRAHDRLDFSGIDDTRVFDIAEARLMANHLTRAKIGIQRNAFLARVLSLSGNSKYSASLRRLLVGRAPQKLKSHIRRALHRFDDYARWNRLIGANLKGLSSEAAQRQRVSNMLASTDPVLVRAGAKRTYDHYNDDNKLLGQVRARLLSLYQFSRATRGHIDAQGWLCRALAESGDRQFKAALEEVAANAVKRKVRKYGRKYAGYL